MPLGSLFKAFPFKRRASTRKPAEGALRVAVVGTGKMGQFHLRHLLNNPLAHVVAVVDQDAPRAASLGRKHQILSSTHPETLVGQIDAAIVATPTATHFSIGQFLLNAGIACLIEKPLTQTPEEADELISLADSKGVALQVGHIERFNPAILEAARHIRAPQFIEVNRLGPYDPRVAGIGVVMDLMIHDLDIVQFLVGQPVTRVEAFGAKVLSDHEDIAKVRLHFEGGCIADLSASRISLERYRRIRVFQKNAYLSIDYAAPHLKIYKKKSAVVKSLSDIEILKPRLTQKDPLSMELDHFLKCVLEKKSPMVTGHHGRTALQLVQAVLHQLNVHA